MSVTLPRQPSPPSAITILFSLLPINSHVPKISLTTRIIMSFSRALNDHFFYLFYELL
jgi:hypothetical protein